MTFQRARTDEQRDERRRTILTTTADMLTGMPVADVSLNGISRRVGLAKSNVLRYFDSREAILLELLDSEMDAWADTLAAALADALPDAPAGTSPATPSPGPAASPTPATDRAARVADTVASTLAARPVTCDLLSAQSSVLERNVSTGVILDHKRRNLALSEKVGGTVRSVLPELTGQDALQVTAALILLTSSAWPSCTPTEDAAAAFTADPALAPLHMTFTDVLGRTLTLVITGLLAERGVLPGQ